VDDGVIFRVKVQPVSDKNEIVGVQGDALKIKISAPPLKGKANKALVEFKDTSILTHLLIRFDSELQKCYNTDVLTNVVHRRITKKARYPKLQRVNPGAF